MSDKSSIEWTDATWNPIRGCSRVSQGCKNCYAERLAARFSAPGQPYAGLAMMTPSGPRWTGAVRMVDGHLMDPLRWKHPRRIFVNSMSDLFHEELADSNICRIFGIMAAAPRHTFQVLTKRPRRMLELLSSPIFANDVACYRHAFLPLEEPVMEWPIRNVWLGVSTEDQVTAASRIPELLATPAAVRFVSAEPLLGLIDFRRLELPRIAKSALRPVDPMISIDAINGTTFSELGFERQLKRRLDWVIVGGESGPGARPMSTYWARSIRDQCVGTGVAFFFKQWGEYVDVEQAPDETARDIDAAVNLAGNPFRTYRVGKKRAGRELDGRTWDEMPR